MYRCVQHLTERAMSVAHIVISLSLTTRAIVKAGLARGNKRALTTLCHQPESQLLGKVAQHDTNQMPKHAQTFPKHAHTFSNFTWLQLCRLYVFALTKAVTLTGHENYTMPRPSHWSSNQRLPTEGSSCWSWEPKFSWQCLSMSFCIACLQ